VAEDEEERLKLGKGVAFVKGRLRHLPQGDDTWEADFRVLPKPIMQTETHYLGLVVTQPDRTFLADRPVQGRPTVNDLATLLAHAMRRPLTGGAHRPRCIHLRGHPQWRELFPHLNEVGIEVSIREELPHVVKAYEGYLRERQRAPSTRQTKPTAEQTKVVDQFPAIAKWVERYGWIEIGQQELFGFVARALHEGGTQVEINEFMTLAEALAELEDGLVRWFEDEGVEIR
jgi:hypothetical protein